MGKWVFRWVPVGGVLVGEVYDGNVLGGRVLGVRSLHFVWKLVDSGDI